MSYMDITNIEKNLLLADCVLENVTCMCTICNGYKKVVESYVQPVPFSYSP